MCYSCERAFKTAFYLVSINKHMQTAYACHITQQTYNRVYNCSRQYKEQLSLYRHISLTLLKMFYRLHILQQGFSTRVRLTNITKHSTKGTTNFPTDNNSQLLSKQLNYIFVYSALLCGHVLEQRDTF